MSRRARNTDPDTSHMAAASINITAQSLRVLVSYYLIPTPLLGSTAYDYAGFSSGRVTHQRCSDLVQAKFIEPVARGKTPSGRLGRVCMITEAGRKYIRDNFEVVRGLCDGR